MAHTVTGQPDWNSATLDLLTEAKLARPDGLADVVRRTAAAAGADVTLYLVDLEQQHLWPLADGRDALPLDGTPAGQAFIHVRTQPGDGRAIWVPMIDGSQRMGVAEVVAHEPPADLSAHAEGAEQFTGLIGHLITVKLPYGDSLQKARRTQHMSPAGELVFAMLPPLTFGNDRTVISAVLEPAYDMGGDAFDYAVDGSVTRVAVFDAMGRGLAAGLASAATLAATRGARRAGGELEAMAEAADRALREQFLDLRFVTGVLAELDAGTGELRYLNAGHPFPVLFRDGKAIRTLTGGRRKPLGVAGAGGGPAVDTMEPGDRLLLFTDGIVEAAGPTGDRFGVDRLTGLAEQYLAERLPPPEVLRRLAHAVIDFQGGTPTDDATLLMLERAG
jgi:phosphoserine phosphatase RsbU/P